MLKDLLIVLFVSGFSTIAFAQNNSVYSDLTPENCKTVSVDQGMAGNYVGKCKGVGRYDLEYNLDDERNSLGVVFPSKEIIDLNFWGYFRGFSELGTKVEWRMKNSKPVALIVRLNVSDQEVENRKTSYLIVAKIGEDNSCVTDVLKPGKNQNEKARRMADRAAAKKCMPDFVVEESNELPADIANWSGQGGDKFIAYPVIHNRLKKLLGDENHKSFLEYFETINPIKRRGNFLFSSGCMIRACTRLESAIAIDLTNRTFHAAIYNELEDTKYFNENGSKTPEPIIKWAKRLEDAKKDDGTDVDLGNPEPFKIDEFILVNNEDLLARLDAYVNELQNNPSASGYIIINGDKNSRTNAEKQIKDHFKNRGVNFDSLVFLNGGGDSKTVIELWIVPAEPPVLEKTVTKTNKNLISKDQSKMFVVFQMTVHDA